MEVYNCSTKINKKNFCVLSSRVSLLLVVCRLHLDLYRVKIVVVIFWTRQFGKARKEIRMRNELLASQKPFTFHFYLTKNHAIQKPQKLKVKQKKSDFETFESDRSNYRKESSREDDDDVNIHLRDNIHFRVGFEFSSFTVACGIFTSFRCLTKKHFLHHKAELILEYKFVIQLSNDF